MKLPLFLLLIFATCFVLHAESENTSNQSDDWNFRITPYFIGPMMMGDINIHNITSPVDVGLDDILNNLEFAAMLNALVSKGNWSLGIDFLYMGLGQKTDEPTSYIQLDQWMGELNVGYTILPWLHALVGARYNNLNTEIEFDIHQPREKSGDVEWIDPIVGARVNPEFAEDWTFLGRADIGGFGWTSELTWQIAAYIDYRASKLISIVGGYRMLSNNYQTGSDRDFFKYNVVVSGPVIGVSFIF